jgi:hypothetical protein
MRGTLFAAFAAALLAASADPSQTVAQAPKDTAATNAKDTPAAEFTRAKLLKVKVNIEFTDVRLGEILKEFAHVAEEKTDEPLMWTYGEGFPYSKKVTFTAKNQPIDAALDELLKKAGGNAGYVVVSKEGDKHDGWVRLTMTGERGTETPPPPPANAAEETEAGGKVTLAKKLIDAGKPASAKPVLEIVVRKFPTTKAAAEAKALLEKIGKE